MAKIAHLLRFCPHGGIRPDSMSSGARGLTGSEQALIAFAEASASAGHRVVVYVPTDQPFLHNGVWYMDIEQGYPRLAELDDADAVVSWLSADPLRWLPEHVLRVQVMQINDWSMCTLFDLTYPHVDLFVAQSVAHRDWLWTRFGHPPDTDRSRVLNNGIWANRYPVAPTRIKNRLIACSSPDRGLHVMLHLWPEIRAAVPDATLHIYYEVRKWLEGTAHVMNEMGQRARYIRDRLTALEGHGVFLHNAVPPMTLAAEMAKSDFYVYPCWTVSFTEGFSVSTMEAMAAGTVPIITDIDALGEVYGGTGAVVVPTNGRRTAWMDQYRDTLIAMLQTGQVPGDDTPLEARRARCREHAKAFDYSIIGPKFHALLEDGLRAKRDGQPANPADGA